MNPKDYKIISPLTEIELDKLHIRYIPMAHLENWYEAKDGYNMMSLVNSPHVSLMGIFKDYGLDWKRIKRTRYWEERLYRILTQSKWTMDKLKFHIKKRWKTFKSIKKHGFVQEKAKDKSGRDTSILVTKEPFWHSRFGVKFDGIGGYEVQNGMGRASAMYALGYNTIPGMFVEDTAPGSKKWKNVTKRFKK